MSVPASWYWSQLKMLLAFIVTAPFVFVACLRHKWLIAPTQKSIKTDWPAPYEHFNGRFVDTWTWKWLNAWAGNPEDGVSGYDAIVWKDGNTLVPYSEYTGLSGWRLAWSWNLRNKVQSLKYRFAIPGIGPYVTFSAFGHQFGFGYKIINGLNVPVGSKLS